MIFTSLHLRFNLMLQLFLFGLSFNLSSTVLLQDRIRSGRELVEAKGILEDNARKRSVNFVIAEVSICLFLLARYCLTTLNSQRSKYFIFSVI